MLIVDLCDASGFEPRNKIISKAQFVLITRVGTMFELPAGFMQLPAEAILHGRTGLGLERPAKYSSTFSAFFGGLGAQF
jgi:hypothetical protein